MLPKDEFIQKGMKKREKILKLVEMWKEKGYKVDDSELKAFINDRTTNETLYMTSK